MIQIFSHVKWFNQDTLPQVPAFNGVELAVAACIVAAGLIVFRCVHHWLAAHNVTSSLDKKLRPFRSWVPLIVRLSTAALLSINVLHDYILAPNVTTTDSTLSTLISGVFIAAAILIGLGLLTRAGAVVLLAGYILVFGHADAIDVLDHFEYVGIAGYLWLRGPGKYSVDSYLRAGKLAMGTARKYALDVYRVGIGIGLVMLALSEKLLNVPAAQDFLNQHSWNFLSVVGISDRNFILIAGAVELLVGIALILNYAPRVLVTVVLLLMIMTALLLGVEEIYGHLFAVGLVAAIWVNDRNPGAND